MPAAWSLPESFYLTLALVSAFLVASLLRKARKDLPPGPQGLPIVGNAFQMPVEKPWVTYGAWAKKYGDVMHVSVFGRPIIFLTSRQAAEDLFERRSAAYSDRPDLTFCGELVGYKDSLPLCKYGDTFREHRKLASEALGPRNTSSWRVVQEGKVREFLCDLLGKPDSFMDHIRVLVASIGFEITHGYTVRGRDDPMALLASEANHNFAQAVTPGAYLCDALPMLRYTPDWTGARFKKQARKFRKTMEALRDGPYNTLKEQVALGTAKPSYTASLIQREEHPTEVQELLYRWSSVSIYGAAADTSVSAVGSIFVALSLYPEVQKKAQEELDRVVGPARLPSFEDRSNLPYLNAIVMEVHRWNPVIPLGIPHRCTQEDVYRGFRIPLGSTLFVNTWAILHDEALYPSPMEFLPERFLQPAENAARGLNPDPRKYAFGYGRRVCPGKDLADDSVFICAAMTLAAFNLGRPNAADMTPAYTSGMLCDPLPFECRITPRSREAEAVVFACRAE
ncbi:cytochrome P450 [Mycena epipterygia]|nr:cytochrome P450 [Mycena epipterygia]